MHRVRMRNFEVFPALDWIAAVSAHIPNKGEHLLRYYGWYSNVNRGKRTKAQESGQHGSPAGTVAIPPPPGSSIFTQRWAELIKKAYAADPLLCPRCAGAMRIIAFIAQPDVSEKILPHLGLWPHNAPAPPDGAVAYCVLFARGCVRANAHRKSDPPPPCIEPQYLDSGRGKS